MSSTGDEDSSVEALAWCNGRLFSAGLHGFLLEYDLASCTVRSRTAVTGGPTWCLALSPNKQKLAVSCNVCIFLYICSSVNGVEKKYIFLEICFFFFFFRFIYFCFILRQEQRMDMSVCLMLMKTESYMIRAWPNKKVSVLIPCIFSFLYILECEFEMGLLIFSVKRGNSGTVLPYKLINFSMLFIRIFLVYYHVDINHIYP